MNKIFNFLILLVLVCHSSWVLGQLNLGLHGGVNISSITPTVAITNAPFLGYDYTYSSSQTGYYIGLFTRLKINKFLSLLPDCSYSQKGYHTYKESNYPGGGHLFHSIYTRIHFLEPGILLEYSLPLGDGRMNLSTGVNAAFPLSGNVQDFHSIYASIRDTTDVQDISSTKMSFGITGLIRYEFNFGLLLEATYNYHFSPQPGINLGIFGFGTGYILEFKKRGE
jgi:hypothetical protein